MVGYASGANELLHLIQAKTINNTTTPSDNQALIQ